MTPTEPMPAQASLPNSYSYTLRASAIDEVLRIDVAPPLGFAANQAALPAVYVLDGNGMSALFREETECAARSPKLAARLFMSVGGLEEDPNNDRLRPYAMVSNLERMTSTLQRRAYPGLKLDTVVFLAETHLSVIPATMSRGLRSVFGDA
jgi:hypothetical protein